MSIGRRAAAVCNCATGCSFLGTGRLHLHCAACCGAGAQGKADAGYFRRFEGGRGRSGAEAAGLSADIGGLLQPLRKPASSDRRVPACHPSCLATPAPAAPCSPAAPRTHHAPALWPLLQQDLMAGTALVFAVLTVQNVMDFHAINEEA